MTYIATKVIRVKPDTKERFNEYAQNGRTADRAINDLLDYIERVQI